MKKFFAFAVCVALVMFYHEASAQIFDKIKNKAKQRADQKVDQAIDKGLDEAEGKNKKKKEDEENKEEDDDQSTKQKSSSKGEQSLKTYSRYDFVPGEKIVYAEDFAQDVIGEFPLKWNTNGTGEVVTMEGIPGRWLKLTEGTNYESPYSNKLPDNYTVEFDLVMDFKESTRVPNLDFVIKTNDKMNYPPGIRLFISPQAGTYSSSDEQNSIDRIRLTTFNAEGKEHLLGKDQLIGEFYHHKKKPTHVAMWIQKQRVRVWINQVKVYDLPKALPEALTLTNFAIETGDYGSDNTNFQYYVSNIKVAAAAPDTRSKLVTEGKFSTTGILFDVNSDKIKPNSYGVLKEIATILSENGGMRVKIIGHTDSDGDDAANLDLSKRRAAAVRTALSKEFDIDGERIESDGMGETKPLGDNKTAEGKAQNRRVEFIKL